VGPFEIGDCIDCKRECAILIRHAEFISASIVPPGSDGAGGEMDPETSSG
jgi:hypothetical protein